MNEYISKEALQDKLNRKKAGPATKRYTEGWNDAILMVKSMIHSEKAADVAPVRHGKWEVYLGGKELMCSSCKTTFWDEEQVGGSNYCPNCGAIMDGDRL